MGKAPKSPAVPPPAPPPPREDEAVADQAELERLRRRRGRASTLLASAPEGGAGTRALLGTEA
ncbi:MAG: hypothetical protein KDG89_06800 [Geminicoccaceae bacterium]|nr:hypothetical protein [Geminicoccaceae bacterium]